MKFNCGGALTALSAGYGVRGVYFPLQKFSTLFLLPVGWTCNPGLARPVSAHLRTETKGRNGKKGTKGQTVWAGGIPGTPISLAYCHEKFGFGVSPQVAPERLWASSALLTAVGLSSAGFQRSSGSPAAISWAQTRIKLSWKLSLGCDEPG